MILKMKKVSLVLMDNSREESLKELRRLGLVHLKSVQGSGPELAGLDDTIARLERGIFSLPTDKAPEDKDFSSLDEALAKADEIQREAERLGKMRDRTAFLDKELERLEPLGDFNPEELTELAERGIPLGIYAARKGDLALFDGMRCFRIGHDKNHTYFAVVDADTQALEGVETVPMPDKGYEALRRELEELKEQYAREKEAFNGYLVYRKGLQEAERAVAAQRDFENYRSGMASEGAVAYLTGYCPVSEIEKLKSSAAREGWALLIQDPGPDENVPTELHNNRVVRMVKPVFDFLGTVPGYREYDISFWFMIFFSFFVSMIIGDAGYGLIFLAVSVVMNLKSRKLTDMNKLLYVLSLCTVAWGTMTGTWFGSQAIASLPFLQSLVVEPISIFSEQSDANVKYLCFVVGTVHLSIGYFISFVRRLPELKAFSEFGWLTMTIGLFSLALYLALDAESYPIPQYALYLVAAGFALVIIFGQQEKGTNFFMGILKGVGGIIITFLDSISSFSNIVSYIRLYAVGLATVAIAQSFNSMAAGAAEAGIAGMAAGVVILLFGHGLNIVMALLSVIVHGVRLNLLEFSGALSLEWSGIKYDPFCEGDEKKYFSEKE